MKIVPLSEETLEEARRLALSVFTDKEDRKNIRGWFEASLDPEKYKELHLKAGTKAKYWVAIDEETNKVIGTTGLYTYDKEKDIIWFGWYCVDPKYRGKGVGSKLLDFTIKKAKETGRRYLKLYTTDSPEEAKAHKLYDKKGFKTIERKEDTMIKELKL